MERDTARTRDKGEEQREAKKGERDRERKELDDIEREK